MKRFPSLLLALSAGLMTGGAHAGGIGDVAVNAHWGANGAGDVIGGSTYDISGATITRVGSVLADTAPGRTGDGDLLLAPSWNPYGSDGHHGGDNAANRTRPCAPNGASNARYSRNSGSFMNCILGKTCDDRDGQATAVSTASVTVRDTGLIGTWTVAANQ